MSMGELEGQNPYASFGTTVADAAPSDRATFIRKTYTHLAAAIYTLVALEWLYFTIIPEQTLNTAMEWMLTHQLAMLGHFGAFLVVSWLANKWAHSETSIELQYAGLGLYVLAESLFLLPLLWLAQFYSLQFAGSSVGVLPVAVGLTLVMFGGLSAIAWFSKADFSFLRTGLMIVGFGAFALICISFVIPSFHLGIWFSAGMIIFASLYILYDTSNIIHHYRPTQHVAASLALFASVVLLFWYILRLLIALSSRD